LKDFSTLLAYYSQLTTDHSPLTIPLYICLMDRIEKIKEFLSASPNDNFLRHALALEYIKAGSDAEARELFEAILTASPDYVGSYYHLAKLLEKLGETNLAIEWYEKGMAAAKTAGDNHSYSELQGAYEDLVY
jgi:tetratricopeptide (TPR) repeat protein